MRKPDDSYRDIRAYLDDLNARMNAQQWWLARHPDTDTDEYEADYDRYLDNPSSWTAGVSTFDPTDPMPNTADVLSVQRFIDLMTVAVTAYERSTNE